MSQAAPNPTARRHLPRELFDSPERRQLINTSHYLEVRKAKTQFGWVLGKGARSLALGSLESHIHSEARAVVAVIVVLGDFPDQAMIRVRVCMRFLFLLKDLASIRVVCPGTGKGI